jgi:hypothetical protein
VRKARAAWLRLPSTPPWALLSAGLIAALLLVVVLLIDVWRLEPLAAAPIVSTLPLATLSVERATRGRPAGHSGDRGALLPAPGPVAIGLLSRREEAWVLVALTLWEPASG